MVFDTILTTRLDNIHISIPSKSTRTQTVPSKSPKRSHRERKRHVHRQIFVPDKPPFVNYASAYINPYRHLTPILINHHHHRRRRFKNIKRSKQITESVENINLNDEDSESIDIITDNELIDLWPSDPNSFDMDFIRKRQIAIDNTYYREIIDTWKPLSLNHLSKLIKELGKNKNLIDYVWIVYYWISQNISYDIDTNQQKLDEIFHSKKTNSDGYATIFQILCDQIDIKCMKILGYAKDYQYHLNQTIFSHPNHTWNAVELDDNHWYLIDSSWGSGYINHKFEYKKFLQTFYFLPRPEQIIYDHLPKESQYQYLAKPISLNDYIHLPYFHSYYFIYNLTLISPRFSNKISFDKNQSLAEILIQAPNDIQLTCLSKNDRQSTCLTQYDASRQIWQCLFAPYKHGFYTLIFYANRLSISKTLINILELSVDISSKDFIRKKLLPITFGNFIEYKCQIYSPLDGVLKQGMKIIIHCRIPNASYGRISIDGIWLDEILIKNEIFKQEIIVPEREIILYAQFNNRKLSNIYSGLVQYLVEK